MPYFAGIGSRATPLDVRHKMSKLSTYLTINGYTLRSGNAEGADQAFASGVVDNKAQIWLPWKNFELEFQLLHPDHDYKLMDYSDTEAYNSIERFHPDPIKLSDLGIEFMSRNYRQIIGLNEPDSEFVCCWTEGGELKGGTAQAIRIANHYNIPVFNLFNLTVKEILFEIEKLNLLF